jgi:hypothetical protein
MAVCHYVHDKIAGKVLIPECWEVVMSGDKSDCTCHNKTSTLDDRVIKLEKEVESLKKILKTLTNGTFGDCKSICKGG